MLYRIIMKAAELLALIVALLATGASAKDETLIAIGAVGIDITPDYPVRLHGYGGRQTNAAGVAQKIYAKALTFGTDQEGPRILFTVDNLGVSGAITDEVAARLEKRRVAREHVAVCSSHTHSAPMLSGVAPNIFSSQIIPEQQVAIERYTRDLVDKLEQVALAALSNRAPSKLSWSEGTVTFAKNRRVIRGGRAQFGENDTAPVDHTLAVMCVRATLSIATVRSLATTWRTWAAKARAVWPPPVATSSRRSSPLGVARATRRPRSAPWAWIVLVT